MSDAAPITPNFIQIPPPNPPLTFDPKGIVEAVKGIVSENGKGFIPATNFNPEQPYKDIKEFVEGRQKRIDESPLNPEKRIADLEGENDILGKRHETDLEKYRADRTSDQVAFHKTLIDELNRYHVDVLRLKDETIGKLRDKNGELKAENKRLDDQHQQDVNIRIDDLQQYHTQILSLTREVSEVKLERLDVERRRLDEIWQKLGAERDRLKEDQKTLVDEKKSWLGTLTTALKDMEVAKLFKK